MAENEANSVDNTTSGHVNAWHWRGEHTGYRVVWQDAPTDSPALRGFRFHFFADLNRPDSSHDEMLARLYCHLLVSHIPPDGIEETLESLSEIFAFQREREQLKATTMPLISSASYVQPARRGIVAERVTSPAFVFEKE